MCKPSRLFSATALTRITTTAFAVVLLGVFVPLAHATDAKGAMLYANGDVAVNGVSVRNSMPVFTGDKIQVGNNSTAAILSVAAPRFVPANSFVILGKSPTQLNSSPALSTEFVEETESKDKDDKECPHSSKRPGHDCGISKAKP